MKAKIETKILKISEIKSNPKNPKKHDDGLLAQSFKEFGQVSPIIVDENNVILAGHGRRDAMRRLGYDEVEVVVKRGLTEEQKTNPQTKEAIQAILKEIETSLVS